MPKGFTKTGQPIIGRKYTIRQGDLTFLATCTAKGFGDVVRRDVVMVRWTTGDESGWLPWPIYPAGDNEPITVTTGWKERKTTT